MARIDGTERAARAGERESLMWQEAQTKINNQLLDETRRNGRRLTRLHRAAANPAPTKLAAPDDLNKILFKLVTFAIVAAVVAGIAGALGHQGLALLLRALHMPAV